MVPIVTMKVLLVRPSGVYLYHIVVCLFVCLTMFVQIYAMTLRLSSLFEDRIKRAESKHGSPSKRR